MQRPVAPPISQNELPIYSFQNDLGESHLTKQMDGLLSFIKTDSNKKYFIDYIKSFN
jgi:hypothetical protein